MTSDDPVAFYKAFLTERHAAFRDQLDAFLTAFIGADTKRKVQLANAALQSLDALELALPKNHIPSWMPGLRKGLRKYVSRDGHGEDARPLLTSVLAQHRAIVSQDWALDPKEDISLDFDSLFQKCYEESRVPELLESLLASLEQVITTGEVDSRRVLRALERAVSIIRRNMRGAYLSTQGGWYFVRKLLDNIILEGLSDVSGLGAVVRGIKTTAEEIDKEMEAVNSSWRHGIGAAADAAQLTDGPAADLTLAAAPLKLSPGPAGGDEKK